MSLILPYEAPIFLAGLVALGTALVLVYSQAWHGRFTFDLSSGIQRTHDLPTPRVGGIAVLLGVITAYFLEGPDIKAVLGPLILASLPAFSFGLLEDVTKRVGVPLRLWATLMCGILGWSLTGVSITNVDVDIVNWFLTFTVVSVLFTAFATAGFANAINMVDGFNGLAAGTTTIILVALGLVAAASGDLALAKVSLCIALPVLGFTVINWPMGKLFLGDGGAYFSGFAIAWFCVLLASRNPNLSSFSLLLICAYPVTEAIYSIWRRIHRSEKPGVADRLHLHSLVNRRLTPLVLSNTRGLSANSVTGAIMWIPAACPAILGYLFRGNTFVCISLLVAFVFLYHISYLQIIRFRTSANCLFGTPTKRKTT